MVITKFISGIGLVHLCYGMGARPYVWASHEGSVGRRVDLPKGDALVLAERLKLAVVQFHSHSFHVVGVVGLGDFNEVELGLLAVVTEVRVPDAFNDPDGSVPCLECLACNGLAHRYISEVGVAILREGVRAYVARYGKTIDGVPS